MIFCGHCNTWIQAKDMRTAYSIHSHAGRDLYMMKAEPIPFTWVADLLAIKPVYNFKRWRLCTIDDVVSYSDHDCLGHPAGQGIYYLYRTAVDDMENYIEAPTKEALIERVKQLPGIKAGNKLS